MTSYDFEKAAKNAVISVLDENIVINQLEKNIIARLFRYDI